jgi:hypothetical protein
VGLQHRPGQLARDTHAETICNRVGGWHSGTFTCGHRAIQGWFGIGFNGDDLGVRTVCTDGHSTARHDAAAADGGEELVDGARVFEELQRERALSGGDRQVVVGLDGHVAALCSDLSRPISALVRVWPHDDDLSSICLCALALEGWRVVGHDDYGVYAEHLRRTGHRLGVVTR